MVDHSALPRVRLEPRLLELRGVTVHGNLNRGASTLLCRLDVLAVPVYAVPRVVGVGGLLVAEFVCRLHGRGGAEDRPSVPSSFRWWTTYSLICRAHLVRDGQHLGCQ